MAVRKCPWTQNVESMSEDTQTELSGVEERWRVDDGCTRCVAVHESL